ncbi:chymotrypsin-like protease [Fistulifera solaris]|uniref:Chymotrypsin-like protease n=1 Tax=Fistulifera solaris TaxID=1519565 RepID=A0A1Z5K1Z4_FISSO|nr:chymotrypsin-like protease [Fistulifera solaris]|eukprot:GAX20310.1 chymotrypsin-like protease [Fistulifera solaris]
MKRWLLFTSIALVTVHADPDIAIEENENSRNVFRRGIHPRGQIVPRMAGGFPSGPGAFPFTVHTFDGDQGVCGGVLVHSDVVVTAASCQSVFEATNTIYIGSNDLYGRDFAPLLAISSALPHPDFDEVTYENDIMLLHLETPVGSAVASIATTIPSEDQLLFALGFGRLNPLDETYPTTRHEVDMPAVSFSSCRDVYADAVNSERNVCAGIAGMGPCDGDEGAPLLDAVTTTLQGIWSYSEGCGAAPAVFTRVAYYDSWIREFICNNSQEPPDDCSSPGEDDDVPVTDDEPTNDDIPVDDDVPVPADDDVPVDDDNIPTPSPTHEEMHPTNGKGKGKGKRSRKSVDSTSHKMNRSNKLSKKSSSLGKGSTGKGSGKGSMGKGSSGKGSLGKGSNGKGSNGKGSSGNGSGGKGSSGKVSTGKGSNGKGSSGKGSTGKGSAGKGSNGKGSSGKGSGGKGSSGKGSGGKGSSGKGSSGKGSSGKGSNGKGSSGKGSRGKGSGGKGSYGKRSSKKSSSGKKSYGKGSSNGKRIYRKGSDRQSTTTSTDDRAIDVSPYNILKRRHNRSPYSP